MVKIIEIHSNLLIILLTVNCALPLMPSKDFDWDSDSFLDLKNIKIPDDVFDPLQGSKPKTAQQPQPTKKGLSSPSRDSLFPGFNDSPPPLPQRSHALPQHVAERKPKNMDAARPVPSKKLGWDFDGVDDIFHKGPEGVVRSWHTKDGKGDDHIWHTKETHHHHHHHHHHASEEDHEHEHGHKHDNWHKHDHGHDHGHEHEHGHDHEHGHEHEHGHNHGHGHEHGHGHAHGHQHGHQHAHTHGHQHGHNHGHEHAHNHGHAHTHTNAHGHEHAHDNKHSHQHGHEHWHDHDHKHGHDHHHHHDHEHSTKGGKSETQHTPADAKYAQLAQLLEGLKKSQNNNKGFLLKTVPQIRKPKSPTTFKVTLDGAAIDLGNII